MPMPPTASAPVPRGIHYMYLVRHTFRLARRKSRSDRLRAKGNPCGVSEYSLSKTRLVSIFMAA